MVSGTVTGNGSECVYPVTHAGAVPGDGIRRRGVLRPNVCVGVEFELDASNTNIISRICGYCYGTSGNGRIVARSGNGYRRRNGIGRNSE